jgi:hypothetical protein
MDILTSDLIHFLEWQGIEDDVDYKEKFINFVAPCNREQFATIIQEEE